MSQLHVSRLAYVALCGVSPLIAVAVVLVFRPGFYSPDSIEQVRQGIAGEYGNLHPPIMALAARATLWLTGDIFWLILAQAAAVLLCGKSAAERVVAWCADFDGHGLVVAGGG